MMNGFSDDIISILKHNNMYHQESIGCIPSGKSYYDTAVLLRILHDKKLIVVPKIENLTAFDYFIISREALNAKLVIQALTKLSICGIIVLEVTGKEGWDEKAVSLFGQFTATKVRYDDRTYIVIHAGVDYGN